MLSGKATNTNVIVFGLTRPGHEPKIYCKFVGWQGYHIYYKYIPSVGFRPTGVSGSVGFVGPYDFAYVIFNCLDV